jgi:hypothetical protein
LEGHFAESTSCDLPSYKVARTLTRECAGRRPERSSKPFSTAPMNSRGTDRRRCRDELEARALGLHRSNLTLITAYGRGRPTGG